jgi:hypothetical protein
MQKPKAVSELPVQPAALYCQNAEISCIRRAINSPRLSQSRLVTMMEGSHWLVLFPFSNSEVSSQLSFSSGVQRAYDVCRKDNFDAGR